MHDGNVMRYACRVIVHDGSDTLLERRVARLERRVARLDVGVTRLDVGVARLDVGVALLDVSVSILEIWGNLPEIHAPRSAAAAPGTVRRRRGRHGPVPRPSGNGTGRGLGQRSALRRGIVLAEQAAPELVRLRRPTGGVVREGLRGTRRSGLEPLCERVTLRRGHPLIDLRPELRGPALAASRRSRPTSAAGRTAFTAPNASAASASSSAGLAIVHYIEPMGALVRHRCRSGPWSPNPSAARARSARACRPSSGRGAPRQRRRGARDATQGQRRGYAVRARAPAAHRRPAGHPARLTDAERQRHRVTAARSESSTPVPL